MSSAAPTSTTDREHRLTVAEGLLSAIDSGPRALEAARKFLELDTDPSVREASTMLREQIVTLRAEIGEADSVADVPQTAARPKRQRRRRPKKETKMTDLKEAAVTGNPPVPGSPSSQTGAEAAQTTAWGGPNPGVLASTIRGIRQAGFTVTEPPNLRKADGWEMCANCVFFNHGCNLYGVDRDGGHADLFHNGQYPTGAGQLCDSHLSLTPEVQRHVNVLDRADNMLAEAARAENGEAIVRARARVEKAQERLDEALDVEIDEAWSPEARAAALIARRQHSHGSIPGRSEGRHVDKFGTALLTRKPDESALHYAMRRMRDKPASVGETSKLGKSLYEDPKKKKIPHVAKLGGNHHLGSSLRGGIRAGAIEVGHHALRASAVEEVRRGLAAHEIDEVKSDVYPGLDRSPKKNWVDKAGGLPRYIERIAKHLHYEKGKEIGHAIAIAVNVVKKMCGSGDTNFPGKQNVNAKSRAEACAAVAQWEAKKGKAKGKSVAESEQLAEFAACFELYEAAFKPIPPSWNLIESILAELAEADGPDWYVGMAELDEALELIDEIGLEAAADELDEATIHRLGFKFNAKMHPRSPKGRREGGRFTKVLDRLHTDMAGHRGTAKEQIRAARHGKQLPKQAGADQGGSGRTAPAHQPPVFRFEDTLQHPERSPRAAEYGLTPASAAKPKSVEHHFRDHVDSTDQYQAAALATARGMLHPGQAAPADLTVDMAIGGVLAAFPNVKDWHLDEPTSDEHGTKSWALHVTLDDGKTHHISVNEDGQVEQIADKPKVAPAKPKLAAAKEKPAVVNAAQTGELVPTGDSNVVSHMMSGTIFKGVDGHFYKHHGDDWMAGKKGPVKGAHLENLDTGTEKTVPYFAIHGKEYPIYAAPGTFQKKELGSPTSADDVFGSLLSSVAGQHGSLSSVSGKNVVVTGAIPGHVRNEVHAMIKAAGGVVHSSVAANTDVLVTGDKVGAVKINAAKKKGVTVIPWDEFKKLVESEIGVDETQYAMLCGAIEEAYDDTAMLYRLRARRDVLARRLEEKVYNAGERRANATIGDDRYPIGDKTHALAALERLNQGGLSNAEKAKVIAKAARHLGGDHALVKRRKKELA